MNIICKLLAVGGMSVFTLASTHAAETPRVLVTIAPVHSLVASILDGVSEPELLLSSKASPHDYALRPSDARRLHGAEVVIWIGAELEQFMTGMISSLSKETLIIGLDHDEDAPKENDHHIESDHHHTESHPWLDPIWAVEVSESISAALINKYPAYAGKITANTSQLQTELTALDGQLKQQLTGIVSKPYLVSHEAYGAFEQRYGLNHQGAVALHPERPPGPRHLLELKGRIKSEGIICLFDEPQNKSAVLKVLTEGTGIKTGILDPMGADLKPGKTLYSKLLQQLAMSFKSCLE